jgi:hypothetical protein
MVFKEIVDARPDLAVDLAPMETLPPRGGHHSGSQTPDNPSCRKRVRERREQSRRRAAARFVRALCRAQSNSKMEVPASREDQYS